MTVIADTRLLLTFKFPPTEEARRKAANLMRESLRRGLLVPSIVVTEFVKLAGKRLGEEEAITFIKELKMRGASVVAADEGLAIEAGRLALRHWDIPVADILIGATMVVHHAEYVVSDDEHFKDMGFKTKWL